MEADLALSPGGHDLRDLYLPGGGPSRLTLRRLLVLIRGLPPNSLTHLLIEQDQEHAAKHDKVAQLRQRTDHYRRQAERQKVG